MNIDVTDELIDELEEFIQNPDFMRWMIDHTANILIPIMIGQFTLDGIKNLKAEKKKAEERAEL